ncbi:hypothetical protein EOD41_09505 [Mucilaginibacter limnophilus]|uniref:2'-5' RNA ligase family protein n=1 Tax=Mucilaginibacter limnophilus TaxID=1932778 RepID=A0A3S2ULT2_9SPHI|nr:2'-5' RNA ligase family protein [Mucilaginibacter limnophilus]RVU00862.1 hypothetical protein EOD41_09505 [Mucilaginibacter limnophilus]
MHYAEYMPIISPPDEINDEIRYFKTVCTDRIGEFKSSGSKAHITIPFEERRQKIFTAEPAIERMEKRLNTMPTITLEINGFDIFPNHVAGNTIYATIEMDDKTKNWFKLLLKEMHLNKRTITPHLTIARGLSNDQLKTLWPYFMKQKFNHRFEVSEMIMLKREMFAHEPTWKVFKRIQFLNRFNVSAPNINSTLF